jgi:hypothetical protein
VDEHLFISSMLIGLQRNTSGIQQNTHACCSCGQCREGAKGLFRVPLAVVFHPCRCCKFVAVGTLICHCCVWVLGVLGSCKHTVGVARGCYQGGAEGALGVMRVC